MNFIKNGLKNIVIYSCGLIIVNGLSFALLPFYTRQFLPSEYAYLTILLSCLPLTRYCLPMEICQAAPVFSADDQVNSVQYISVGFWFALSMNVIAYTICYIANTFLHFMPLAFNASLMLFSLLAIDCLFYYSTNILRWELRPYLYNTITAGTAILEAGLTLTFVLVLKLSVFGVCYAWLISRLLGLIVAYFFTRQHYAFFFNINVLKKMLSFSLPLVLTNLAYNINRSFDRWLIASVLGLSVVGIYGAGATIGGSVNFIMASISAALTPIIYRNHNKDDAAYAIIKLFYVVITLCTLVGLLFALFNKEILYILVSPLYYQNLAREPIVPIVVLSAILSGIYVFSPGITIKKKTGYVIWFNLSSLLVNVFLCYSLINQFGITGVACATCASIIVNAILYMSFSQKFYKLPFCFKHLVTLVSFFLIFYMGAIWLGLKYQPFEPYNLLLKAAYCSLFILVALSLLWKINKHLLPATGKMAVSPLVYQAE